MSAIAGVIMLDGSAANIDVMKKMLGSMKHCGPDAQHAWQSDNAVFGQALLATTPEALNETQPWTDSISACVVVTDSRLDNREILAAALGFSDRAIDTVGDAELIFAAYQIWGEACPEKLLGDFAFAIWNPKTAHLFCARDQLGIRPFYYHSIADSIFAFATTSEALRGLLQKPAVLDEGRLADAMTDQLEGYDRTSTFFRDIKRLPPAHSLNLQLQAAPQLHCYWQPLQKPPSPFPDTEKQWLEQLEALFVEAVHCRLRSHAPISSMLSGGLDSSAIVAVACEKLKLDGKPDLSTFSAVSGHADCAETRAIRLMQSAFSLTSTEIDPENSPELMQAIAAQWPQFDEPFEASNTLVHAQYLTAHKNKLRIMLDGIDADALLAEGDYLHDLARTGQWRRVWRESRALVRFWGPDASLVYFLRPLVSEFLIPGPVRRFARHLRGRIHSSKTPEQTLICPAFAEQVDLASRYRTLAINTTGIKAKDNLGHAAYCAIGSSYTTAAVERYHRLASLYGIEPRHPFLDRRLVEFCVWLPQSLRLRDGYPKWGLRQIMSQKLPVEVAWRRGKEHLGWKFNQNLWKASAPTLLSSPLHDQVKAAVFDTVQTLHAQLNNLMFKNEVKEKHIEPLIKLAALNSWLGKAD